MRAPPARLPTRAWRHNPGMASEPEYCCAVLTDERGWLLLQLRSKRARHAPDQLCCFGGRREVGEAAHACLARELTEELGLESAGTAAQACCELWQGARLIARFYRLPQAVKRTALRVEPGSHALYAPWASLPGLPLSRWHRLVLAAVAHGRPRVDLPAAS